MGMIENGARNVDFGAERFGFRDLAAVNWNLGAPQLYEEALQRQEARIAAHGALVADTGAHTGRSPKDKFVVRDADTESVVWWDNNNAMTPEHFDALLADFIAHAKGKTLFAQDLYAGADPALRVRARVFTEYAWHSLFIRNLLIRPPGEELATFVPELTIVDLPSFRADSRRHGARTETIIACDFTRKIVLIGGTSYAGEMKKAVFTVLNYLLPAKQVHADALLGQCRHGRRRGDLLRPLGHRQDHALRRSEPHADRRRRARLGPRRHVQFRGRLLRQGDQAVARGRAGDLCDDRTLRHRDGERGARSGDAHARLRRRFAGPRTPASPIRFTSSPTPRRPAAPVIPRTSSC